MMEGAVASPKDDGAIAVIRHALEVEDSLGQATYPYDYRDDEEEEETVVPLVPGSRPLSIREVAAESRACYPVYGVAGLLIAILIAAIVFVPAKEDRAEQKLQCELNITNHSSWNELLTAVDSSTELRCTEPNPWGKPCACQNPIVGAKPSQPANYAANWEKGAAFNQALIQNASSRHLDVVMIGDSIMEHWHGTSFGNPTARYADNVQVYHELFSGQNGGISGLALGISGDRCPNLLYRLQRGEMPSSLQPAVWWVLIGTNDRGGYFCKNDHVIAGNIAVVEHILKHRPKSTVVINSLLPRGNEKGLLWWEDYSYINDALACYAASTERVEFLNATSLFLNENNTVDMTLLPDELHPNAQGSRVWGEAIVDRVHEILQ